MDGDELLRRVEAYGGFVVGHMVDRIARDWTLRAYDGVGEIWDHYPQRCPVTSQLLAGANTKWILVPKAIDGVETRLLNPRYAWKDANAYDERARALAEEFCRNFERFEVPEEIRNAGPRP